VGGIFTSVADISISDPKHKGVRGLRWRARLGLVDGRGEPHTNCPARGGRLNNWLRRPARKRLHVRGSQTKLSHVDLERPATPRSLPCPPPRLHCILCGRDLIMLAFVFGLCRWSANFGRFCRLLPNMTNFPFKVSLRRSPHSGSRAFGKDEPTAFNAFLTMPRTQSRRWIRYKWTITCVLVVRFLRGWTPSPPRLGAPGGLAIS
jgi:hypothetical protein